ncbi:MAG: Ldh family oxidoreductase [Rhizobiales bacterium]|nr:Ldh family oxidoreductase [Hyphomicrobiales bacterium]
MAKDTTTLTIDQARRLTARALTKSGAKRGNIKYLLDAIIETERQGLSSHGLFWVPIYCEHLKCGKLDGQAKPEITRLSPVSYRADAKSGFAHPAIDKGFAKIIPAAKRSGIAAIAVTNSYNCGTLGIHTARLAEAGLIGWGFTNAPASIAPTGGKTPVVGTNPVSMAVPDGNGNARFVIDQSSSVIAKSEVMRHKTEGKPIPLGWALDADGNPTDDPVEGLKGSMAPSGGQKGFGQGLMVEIMAAAASGAMLGSQCSSFATNDGGPCNTGQFFIAIDPQGFSGGLFGTRVDDLCAAITGQDGARLPGSNRAAQRTRIDAEGIALKKDLLKRIRGHCK